MTKSCEKSSKVEFDQNDHDQNDHNTLLVTSAVYQEYFLFLSRIFLFLSRI